LGAGARALEFFFCPSQWGDADTGAGEAGAGGYGGAGDCAGFWEAAGRLPQAAPEPVVERSGDEAVQGQVPCQMEGGSRPPAGTRAGRAVGGLPEPAPGPTDVRADAKRSAGKRRLAARLAGAAGCQGQEQSAQDQPDGAAQKM